MKKKMVSRYRAHRARVQFEQALVDASPTLRQEILAASMRDGGLG
jgi:hypothetical protein